MREELKRRGRGRFSCRNVQELTVTKSVEIRNLIVGGNVDGRKILGLVKTNERLRKMDWGEGMEHEQSINVVGGKKGGGLSLLKIRERSNFERVESERMDIIVVKLVLRELSIYIILVYINFKN